LGPRQGAKQDPREGLEERLYDLARSLAERETEHADGCARAARFAAVLHNAVQRALARFEEGLGELAHRFKIELSDPRVDDKHLRSVEFEVSRGRHRAIVTVKSRGEVTFVGPFHKGKPEGPCRTFPIDADDEVDGALVVFLAKFLEEAATP
jgi:hypothetical protein